MLTLLHPLLAGSVALAGTLGVLLLYVLKLRRRPVRVSTTAIFAPAIDDLEANIPWRRLRPSWMLLLHLSIIWLLALAFGQPVSKGIGEPSNIIFILDRSASMSAKVEESTTSLDRAKAALLTRAEGVVESGGRVALIAVAERPSVTLPWSTSRSTLRSTVQSIESFDQPARLERAIEMARTLAASARDVADGSEPGEGLTPDPLRRSSGTADRDPDAPATRKSDARIVLLTDGMTPIAPDAASGIEIIRITAAIAAAPDNIGIAAVSLRRVAAASSRAQLLIRLVNASTVERVVPLRIDVNGDTRQRVAITVPAQSGGTDSPSGEISRTFDLDLPTESIVSIHITRPDALAADDAAHVVITEPQPLRLLLVAPEDVVSRGTSDLSFILLRDCLQELVDADVQRKGELLVIAVARLNSLNPETLSRFHAAVFDRVDPPATFPLGTLSFGVPAGLVQLAAASTPNGPTRPVWWDRAQPVFDDNPIEGVLIRSTPALGPLTSGTLTLARGVHGPLILSRAAQPATPGRIAAIFPLAESNWPLQVSFPIFIARAVQTLSPQSAAGVGQSALTSDTVTVPVPNIATSNIEFRSRDAAMPPIMVPVAGQSQLQFGPVEQASVWTLNPAAGTINDPIRAIAFNLTNERISRLGPTIAARATDNSTNSSAVATLFGAQWWRWCVIAAAILLALEWCIFAFRQRSAGR